MKYKNLGLTMKRQVFIKNPFERFTQKGAAYALCMCLLLAGSFFSCTEKVKSEDTIYLKKLLLFTCENSSKSISADASEYIKFSAINNNILKVEQKFFMNCCCEDIGVEISSIENVITISITDEDCGCNCICPRIVSYEIGNLQENSIYEFIFLRNTQEYHTCELLFTNQVGIAENQKQASR